MRMERVHRILDKPYLHRNLTLGKLISFSLANGVGTLAFVTVQIPLIEVLKMHYLVSTVIAGAVGLLVKFVISSVTVYGRNKR